MSKSTEIKIKLTESLVCLSIVPTTASRGKLVVELE